MSYPFAFQAPSNSKLHGWLASQLAFTTPTSWIDPPYKINFFVYMVLVKMHIRWCFKCIQHTTCYKKLKVKSTIWLWKWVENAIVWIECKSYSLIEVMKLSSFKNHKMNITNLKKAIKVFMFFFIIVQRKIH